MAFDFVLALTGIRTAGRRDVAPHNRSVETACTEDVALSKAANRRMNNAKETPGGCRQPSKPTTTRP